MSVRSAALFAPAALLLATAARASGEEARVQPSSETDPVLTRLSAVKRCLDAGDSLPWLVEPVAG